MALLSAHHAPIFWLLLWVSVDPKVPFQKKSLINARTQERAEGLMLHLRGQDRAPVQPQGHGVQGRQRWNFHSKVPSGGMMMSCVHGYSLRKERNLRRRVNVWVEQRSNKGFPFRDLHLPCEVEGSRLSSAPRLNARQEESGKYLERAVPTWVLDFMSKCGCSCVGARLPTQHAFSLLP